VTRRYAAALVAGFIFGFTPIRLSHLHHVQLLSLMWLPLIFVFFDRWLNARKWRDAIAIAFLFVLQYLTTIYLALYLIPVLLVFLTVHCVLVTGWSRRLLIQGLGAALVATAALAPFLKHSRAIYQEWDFRPNESLKIFFSSDLWANLLAVFPSNLIYGKVLREFSTPPYERFYFTGLLAILLVVLACGKHRERAFRLYLAASIACYVIALGPVLQFSGHVTRIPLPYKWIFDSLPGFSMLRVPSRAGLILLATLTVLASIGWLHLYEWLQSKWELRGRTLSERGFCAVTLLVLGAEFLSIPIPMLPEVSGAKIPPVYDFLKNYPEVGGILELPVVFREDGGEATVRAYTYFSTYHFKPVVIGYSGYFPPPFYELVSSAQSLPQEMSLDTFEAIGVRTIVLHGMRMNPEEKQAWEATLQSNLHLKRVASFPDGDEVISIQPHLRISQDLSDVTWRVDASTSMGNSGREMTVWLRAEGLHVPSIDYLVNPQLPHPPEKMEARVGMSSLEAEWLDSARHVVYHQETKVRLPYLLNQASIPVNLKKPKHPGVYLLRVRILESPPLDISAKMTIP